MTLAEIKAAFDGLPSGRPVAADDWRALSARWRAELDERIDRETVQVYRSTEILSRQARNAKTKDEKDIKIPDETHTQEGFRPMGELVKEFTQDGKVRTDREAVEYALEHVDQFKPNTIQTVYDRGGFLQLNDKSGKSSPLYADRPYNTFESQLYLFQRFDTVSGRLTFYVDHPLWVELGAAIVTAREPIRPKKYPLALMTPHARWSIHSTYKTSAILQRLQRVIHRILRQNRASPRLVGARPRLVHVGDCRQSHLETLLCLIQLPPNRLFLGLGKGQPVLRSQYCEIGIGGAEQQRVEGRIVVRIGARRVGSGPCKLGVVAVIVDGLIQPQTQVSAVGVRS